MGLFSFIGDMVSDVIGQITQFADKIENEALTPVRNMIGQVNGGIWRGKGADAFVEEMSNTVVPEIGRLIASLFGGGGSFVTGLSEATNIINEVDDAVNGIANELADLFDGIF